MGKGVYVCDTRVLNIWGWQKYSSCLGRYRGHLHVSESSCDSGSKTTITILNF